LRNGAVLATTLGEVGYNLSRQAIAKAGEAAEESRERLGDFGEQLGSRAGAAGERASDIARSAGSAGRDAADGAQKLMLDGSAVVRELGQDLIERAGKVLARLRD